MKRRYKVLPLPDALLGGSDYLNKIREQCLQGRPDVPAVFHRPGYYFDRMTGKTWVEFGRRAVEYGSLDAFEYDLEQAPNEPWMDEHIYQALSVILKARLGCARQAYRFKMESDRRLLQRDRVARRPYDLAARKRFFAFKKYLDNRAMEAPS